MILCRLIGHKWLNLHLDPVLEHPVLRICLRCDHRQHREWPISKWEELQIPRGYLISDSCKISEPCDKLPAEELQL